MARAAVRPSMPGIDRSISTASKNEPDPRRPAVSNASTASSPLLATVTVWPAIWSVETMRY
jgi:hypothetical protein